jgi:hypothetical protein
VPIGPAFKVLGGGVPDGYVTKEAVTGAQLAQSFQNAAPTNRIRIKCRVTTSGSTGTGTSTLSALLEKLQIFKGDEASVRAQTNPKPMISIENAGMLEAVRFSKARTNNTSRGTFAETDETLAGNSTYYLLLDILANLNPGQYTAILDVNAASVLAGYSPVPTGVSFSFMCIYIDEGIGFKEEDVMRVYLRTTVTELNTAPVREVMIKVAGSATAYTLIGSFAYDQAYNATALLVLAEAGLLRVGSPATTTVIYKSSIKAKALYSTWTTATTMYVGTVA